MKINLKLIHSDILFSKTLRNISYLTIFQKRNEGSYTYLDFWSASHTPYYRKKFLSNSSKKFKK